MLHKFNVLELIRDGFIEIKVCLNLYCNLFFHFILPLTISFVFAFFSIKFDNDIISNIIGSISIFSGLLFSVIFVVTENYSKRKADLSNNFNEEAKSYLKRYKDFSKHISTLILFSILIAMCSIIFLLLFLFVTKASMNGIIINEGLFKFFENYKIEVKENILMVIQTLILIFLFNYLLTVVALIKEIYAVLFDNVNYDN